MKKLVVIVLLLLNLQLFAQTQPARDSSFLTVNLNERIPGIKSTTALRPYLISGGMLSYGLLSLDSRILTRSDHHVHHEMMESYSGFSTIIDNHLRYVPVLAVYSLNLAGIKGRNSFIDRTGVYLLASFIADNSADYLKRATDRLRPDGSDRRSFPSGHTTSAFVAAEFMRQEYKDVSPWYGYAAYSVAAATGTLRMMNNKHWLSDVVAGAGLGIISTKISYLAYPWLKKQVFGKKNRQIETVPIPFKGGIGVNITASL